MKTLIALARLLVIPLKDQWTKCGKSIEDRDPLDVVFHIALLVLYILGLTATTLGLVALVCKFWTYLLIPSGIVWLICYYAKKNPPSELTSSTRTVDHIEEVRARAKKTYPIMKQAAYLLFTDLCRYLSGLVAPFSLSAVTAEVNFDITASLVTQFHFVIGKGRCDAAVATIKEILDTIIFQHLQAQDLPISIPAIYTAADGTTWPGLVVDGVYDLGNQYRVDLVITNEAEVAALKAKGLSWSDDDTDVTPHDPDFD